MRLRRGRAFGCVAGIGASGDEESRDFSHFEDDGEDEGALGSLLVDVAFQVHADFFFDNAPVGLFLGVGLLDRPDDHVARAGDELLPVVAQKAAGDDFRQRFDFSGVFVDGDDGHDDAVFGEMLPVANDELLDLFERAGIDQNAARRKRLPAISPLSGKFNWLPIFDEQDFSRHYAKLMRQGCVTKQMPVFAMNGDEVARANELENKLLFFLAGVAGNVNDAAAIFVIDQGAAAEHVVQHAEDGFFVAGNDARGKNDRVVLLDRDPAVIVHGDARERRHRLGLAAAGNHDQALRVERADVLRAHDHPVGNAQAFEIMRDFDVVHHAAADKGHLSADALRDFDDLLDAVEGRCEAGEHDLGRRRAAELFNARDNCALRRREAGPLDVRAVAEERQDALVAVAREGVHIERGAVHRRVVDLEVAGVEDNPERRADRERDAIDRAVSDADEFDFIRSDLDAPAGENFAQRNFVEQGGFFEALLYQSESEPRAVDGHVEIPQNIGQCADVVLMTVREDDGADARAVLLQIRNVGNDKINAQKLRLREHHARVDDEDVLAITQREHVHSEFAKTAERDGCEGGRGRAQRIVGSMIQQAILSQETTDDRCLPGSG